MQEIESKLTGISNYIGSFEIYELVKIRLERRVTFLTIDLGESLAALGIYTSDRATNVYICDPLGVLSAGLPPQLIEFLQTVSTETSVAITEQLSTTCTDYIISFVTFMSKYHSYCKFVGHFTDNLDFNDYIIRYVL